MNLKRPPSPPEENIFFSGGKHPIFKLQGKPQRRKSFGESPWIVWTASWVKPSDKWMMITILTISHLSVAPSCPCTVVIVIFARIGP